MNSNFNYISQYENYMTTQESALYELDHGIFYIKQQTLALCLEAIRRDIREIRFIKNITDEILVTHNHYENPDAFSNFYKNRGLRLINEF